MLNRRQTNALATSSIPLNLHLIDLSFEVSICRGFVVLSSICRNPNSERAETCRIASRNLPKKPKRARQARKHGKIWIGAGNRNHLIIGRTRAGRESERLNIGNLVRKPKACDSNCRKADQTNDQ